MKITISPPMGVCESLAVFQHELNVTQATWDNWSARFGYVLRSYPMHLCHLRAVRERATIRGNPTLEGFYDRWISDNRRDIRSILADRDYRPIFESAKLGKRETARHPHAVFALAFRCLRRILDFCQDSRRSPAIIFEGHGYKRKDRE